MEIFLTSPYYPIIVSIIVSIISGYLAYKFALNRFYKENQYQNKIDQYKILVDTMRGWIKVIMDQTAQQKFTDSYRAIWLYGSPNVIKILTKFYKTLHDSPDLKQEQREIILTDCLRKAVIEMRKDLGAKGKLSENDFDFYV